MGNRYGVIDLFAGPGGLGEGFARLEHGGEFPFRIVMSAESDAAAHATLRLRAFVRAHLREEGSFPPGYAEFHAGRGPQPDWAEEFPTLWSVAEAEARRLTIGSAEATEPLQEAIRSAMQTYDDTVVIGGPPCQAYSLVGRARNRGVIGYQAEDDHRHYLYRHYIEVLRDLRPAAFVMENVKGMLSASVAGRRVFDMIVEDLRSVGGATDDQYELVPLSPASLLADDPSDFIVQAEDFGVPQRRHRIIIVGLRRDVARRYRKVNFLPLLQQVARETTVREVIGGLPPLRSGLSREPDHADAWQKATSDIAEFLSDLPETVDGFPGKVEGTLASLPELVSNGCPQARESHDLPSETLVGRVV